ncbi:MAG: response regulator [Candidatus Omnitrophota bacterium]
MTDVNINASSKILVVDDDKTVRGFLELFLKTKGFANVVSAENGEDAIKIVEKENIKLILLDVMLPGMNGVEVLRKIKAINKDISVIMITGYPDEEKAKEAIREGVYDYIIKPFDLFYLELILLTKLIQLGYHKS